MAENKQHQNGSHSEATSGGREHKAKSHKKHHQHAQHHEEHEEGWIVSFADNVLLQMGFFVILLALNLGPKGGGEGEGEGSAGSGEPGAAAMSVSDDRFLDFAIEMRSAFNRPIDLNSKNPDDLPMIRRLLDRGGRHAEGQRGESRDSDRAQVIRPTDFEGDGGLIEFDAMCSSLDESANSSIHEIAQRFVGSRWMIEVRGHASAAESNRKPRVARALAYDRAFHVAEALVAEGLEWRQIRVVSAGEADPAIPRASTQQQHGSNQRVEILKLNETVPPDEFVSPSR